MRTALMKIHINVFQNNLEIFMITHRQQVTDMIISAKVLKSIKWADVAKEIGLSKGHCCK
jgi:cyanate lyase